MQRQFPYYLDCAKSINKVMSHFVEYT